MAANAGLNKALNEKLSEAAKKINDSSKVIEATETNPVGGSKK